MTDLVISSDPTPATHHLRELLDTDGLTEHAIAEAISVGPDAAAGLVSSLVEAACATGAARAAAVRAAWLARELRLEQAVPALTRCVEQVRDDVALRDAAVRALERIGPAATASLLAAFEGAGRRQERSRIAEALALADGDGDRVRAALVRTLEEEPELGASLLAQRGDWRAVPDLLRTFDRLARAPIADCVLCEGMQLSAIASAVRALGGRLSPARRATLEDVLERGDPLWTPAPDAFLAHAAGAAPARRAERPGRNDPCPCGSGKKYKRCHLEEDRRDAHH